MSVQVERWIFSVDEFHRMSEAGILSEDDRVELIDGELVRISPIGSLKAGCVKRLIALFSPLSGKAAIISAQDPVYLNDYSEPQPDIALLKPRNDFYASSHPAPDDVLLIIEVADSSIDYDRNVKLPLYAKAGIPEAWLVILPEDRVEAHSQPVDGVYEQVRMAKRGECLSPKALPELTVSVDEILG